MSNKKEKFSKDNLEIKKEIVQEVKKETIKNPQFTIGKVIEK